MNLKETTNPHYILREFLVHHDSEDSEGRHISQFHFKAWPDHGVPHDPGTVLGFLSDVTLRQSTLASEGVSPGPIVVHCSAGIGRTGTFIVIDILINLITYQGRLLLRCIVYLAFSPYLPCMLLYACQAGIMR